MKKLLYFSFILFVFSFFSSCNSDDSKDDASVVGTWGLTSVTVKGNLKKDGQTIPIDESQNADACASKTTTTFQENGTGTAAAYALDSAGNCNMTASENFTYTYNPSTKVLTETSNGVTESITLTELTSNKLVFGQTFDNVNFGQFDPQLEGFYFTGTISTNLTKK